jgi:hypothetical protein
VDNENNPENIDQEMIVDAIAGSLESERLSPFTSIL